MSKADATNTFGEGLIMDLNPMTTPNNVMTNCLNGTLITFNGNEFVLQNDMGNGRVETAKLPTGFVPVGVKEYGGIIYVASYNPMTNEGQLGCFPSPERNLTSDELGLPNLQVTDGDFKEGGKEITSYYKRIDCMPEGVYLNPGDQFGILVNGGPRELLSYFDTPYRKFVTLHPAILDDLGNINYIDEQFKENGKYTFPFGKDISGVEGNEEAFESLQVYTGKKSGKLLIIVELETLKDFIVTRSIMASKGSDSEIKGTGSSEVDHSQNPDKGEDSSFIVKFFNSGWSENASDAIRFTGVKFTGNGSDYYFSTSDLENNTIQYAFGGFSKGTDTSKSILKYKIVPYTQLGPNAALARSGIINFNLLGTGNIILNEWRYYIDNNNISINYGFDLNLLEGETVQTVTFQFYDVYYNKVYDKIYTCQSSINGNFNGNFSERLDFRYDLKYADTYEEGIANNKYIYDNLDKLNSNQLIKNNLYLVKIDLSTKGLVTSGNADEQVAVKTFYRFMYTTDIFNQAYIDGKEQNFSVIPVDPYTVELSAESSTEDVDFKPLAAASQNGNISPYDYAKESDKERINNLMEKTYKANVYQDYELKNSTVKVKSSIKNFDHVFGDFNPGWLNINIEKDVEIDVKYDNSEQILKYQDALSTTESTEYVDLTNGDAEDEVINLNETTEFDLESTIGSKYQDKYDFLGNKIINELNAGKSRLEGNGDTDSDEYKKIISDIEKLELCFDRQVYCVEKDGETNVEVPEKDAEGNYKEDSIKIKFPGVRLRATRRVSGSYEGSLRYTKVNELRPSWYPEIEDSEAQALLAGGSVSASNLDGNNALRIGGETNRDHNYSLYWDSAADNRIFSDDTSVEVDYATSTSNSNSAYTYDKVMSVIGNCISNGTFRHSAVIGFMNIRKSGSWKEEHNNTYLSIGYLDQKWGDYSNYLKPNVRLRTDLGGRTVYILKTATRKDGDAPSTVVTLWRRDSSQPGSPQYAAINFGYNGYKKFKENLQTILERILVVQTAERSMWIQAASHVVYHEPYNTKVNVGVPFNKSNIEVLESPIKLYNGDSFDVETLKNNIPSDWEVDSDLWYKVGEDGNVEASGERTVKQCSFLNIPFEGIEKVEDTNDATRYDKSDIEKVVNLVYNFNKIDPEKEDSDYVIPFILEVGGQMDIKSLSNLYLKAASQLDSIVPKYYYNDMDVQSDAYGQPFNDRYVYLLTKDDKIINCNSDYASNITVWGGKTQNYKDLFTVKSEGSGSSSIKIPVLYKFNNDSSHTLCTNSDNGDCRKQEMQGFNFYDKVYFDLMDGEDSRLYIK